MCLALNTCTCRRVTPWYDVRFRGYGQNKIVHLEASQICDRGDSQPAPHATLLRVNMMDVCEHRCPNLYHQWTFTSTAHCPISAPQVMNASGFKFVVHPSAWLVHRPHAMTAAKLQHARDYQVGHHASAARVLGRATSVAA
jgi:hypothetical protein